MPDSSSHPRNPAPTVDLIIRLADETLVLIERRNPPHGWALPGGFVDYGESLPDAARREAKEETGLDVQLVELLGVYSDPQRDPRQHTLSAVYVATAKGSPRAGDDAASAQGFAPSELPTSLCFDHGQILKDYFAFLETGLHPKPQ